MTQEPTSEFYSGPFEPWMFECKLEASGLTFFPTVQLRNMQAVKDWSGKTSKTLLPSIELAQLLHAKNPEVSLPSPEILLQRCRDFLTLIGFHFPLPLGPRTFHTILSLQNFPSKEDWEKLPGGVDYCSGKFSTYLKDVSWFAKNRYKPGTFAALFRWLQKASRAALSKPTMNDRAAYARMILRRFEEDRGRLEDFYFERIELPTNVREMLSSLRVYAHQHKPVQTEKNLVNEK